MFLIIVVLQQNIFYRRSSRSRERRRSRDRDSLRTRDDRKDKDRDREKDRDSRKDRDKDKNHKDKERERDKEKRRSKERERSKEKERPRSRERERGRSRERHTNKRERSKEKDNKEYRSKSRGAEPKVDDLPPEERDLRTVFCMQLSQRIRAKDLEEFFSSVGKVRDVRLITCNKTRRFKGIAYIEFKDAESVPLVCTLKVTLNLFYNIIKCPLIISYFRH